MPTNPDDYMPGGDKRCEAMACYALGRLFKAGMPGVPRDPWATERWWRQASALGHMEAQQMLGVMYSGECEPDCPLPRNTKEALRLWRLSAEQGHQGAIQNINAMVAAEPTLMHDIASQQRIWN